MLMLYQDCLKSIREGNAEFWPFPYDKTGAIKVFFDQVKQRGNDTVSHTRYAFSMRPDEIMEQLVDSQFDLMFLKSYLKEIPTGDHFINQLSQKRSLLSQLDSEYEDEEGEEGGDYRCALSL